MIIVRCHHCSLFVPERRCLRNETKANVRIDYIFSSIISSFPSYLRL